MKICTSCKTEIHSEAKRCPHCQSFQKWWYGFKPSLPLIILIIPFLIFMTSDLLKKVSSADFEELDGKVTLKKIREEIVQERPNFNELKIIVELKNHTNKNWEKPNFEVTIKNIAGEVIDVRHTKEYRAKLPANGTTHVALKFPASGSMENYQTEVKLIEMKQD